MPPKALNSKGQPAYLVKATLNLCCRNVKLEYLIDGPKEQCWMLHNVLNPLLCHEFHIMHLEKPGPRPRGHPRKSSAPRLSSLWRVESWEFCYIYVESTLNSTSQNALWSTDIAATDYNTRMPCCSVTCLLINHTCSSFQYTITSQHIRTLTIHKHLWSKSSV